VFEVLNDLLDVVWRSYGTQIQQGIRRDRVVTPPVNPANLGDRDVPFQDGSRLLCTVPS
jgi:hypothetical protein